MGDVLKRLAKQTAKRLNIGLTSAGHYQELEDTWNAYNSLTRVMDFGGEHVSELLEPLRASKAQFRQDIFVLAELALKREGYFVEFGATDGFCLSNTYLLEKQFGWSGILAEPARCWHRALKIHRSCHIETDCVWRESNHALTFNEVAGEKELSTINTISSSDEHAHSREKGKTYEVRTISLRDMLVKYRAPRIIDYLSIDTEGSEFEILNSFDFDEYQFRVITCEHNHTPQRESILALLSSRGYTRKFEQHSIIDDWFVNANLL